MKKSIVLTLIVALLLAMTSSVFAVDARNITVSFAGVPETVKQGDEFTLTVSFSEAVSTCRFYIKYNSAVLEYVDGSAADQEVAEAGSVLLGWLGREKTEVTLKFKVVGEAGAEGVVSFENVQLVAKDEAVLVPDEESVDVKVAGETVDPTPVVPDDENTGSTTTPSEEDKGDEEQTGKPTSMPKTGVNYVVAGGVVLALISLVAVAKKM